MHSVIVMKNKPTTLKDKLQIAKVILKNSSFSINKDIKAAFLEAALESGENKTQSYEGVINIHLLSHKNNINFVYIFEFECGSRVVKTTNDKGEPYDEIGEEQIVYSVNATFEVSYLSETELTEDEINKYADKYVIHHVWPYWREYFQNSLSRMEAPKLQIPLSYGR